MFDENTGLSNMTQDRVCIGSARHEAWVSSNEMGTEMAAATAFEPLVGIVKDPQIVCADRPFMYLVREDKTGAILFMGRVMKPQDPGPAKP